MPEAVAVVVTNQGMHQGAYAGMNAVNSGYPQQSRPVIGFPVLFGGWGQPAQPVQQPLGVGQPVQGVHNAPVQQVTWERGSGGKVGGW